MTAKEAYALITSKYPTMRVASCCEYDSVFVFQLAPISATNPTRLLTGLTSVNKKSGVVRTFKPTDIPFGEYQRGRKIPASVYGGD